MSDIEFESDPEFEISFEPEVGIPFYDSVPKKSLEVSINREQAVFTPDNCYVVIYRKAPEFTYIHQDVEDGERYYWDMTEFAEWLAGFSWDDHAPKRTRNHGRDSMDDLCGWQAQTLVADYPSAEIKNLYEISQMTDLYKLAGEVSVQDIIEERE